MRWIFHECLYREDMTFPASEHSVHFDLIWAYHWNDHIEYRAYGVLLMLDYGEEPADISYHKSEYTTMVKDAKDWFDEAKIRGKRSDFFPYGSWPCVSEKAYARWPKGVRTRIEEMIPLMRIML